MINVTRSSMPLYEDYCESIKPLWESCWLTNMGKYHQELEGKLKVFLDVPELSLMVNGHMALELAIQSFGFSEGSEVITTPYTFISTTHAIVRNRLTPVFCDVKKEDGTINPDLIEELITEKTVAILPVHVYGNICDVDAIQTIADKYNLKVIYDAAHAFGMKYRDKGIGFFGDASAFSFHATKLFHTIEGGAVSSREHWIYERLYNLKNFGIRDEELVVSVGANAKMNEFAAIMGLLNLERINEVIGARKRLFEIYEDILKDVPGIKFLTTINNKNPEKNIDLQCVTRNYSYLPILVENEYPISRDDIYERLKENKVNVRKYFYPLTADQACFKNKYRSVSLPNARKLASEVIILPLYETLEVQDVQRVCSVIQEAL